MPAVIRVLDRANERARDLIIREGREVREARVDRDLSLRALSAAVGMSPSKISRIERGLVRSVSVEDLCRLNACVGLELAVRSFPGGQPLRDTPQAALLSSCDRTSTARWLGRPKFPSLYPAISAPGTH